MVEAEVGERPELRGDRPGSPRISFSSAATPDGAAIVRTSTSIDLVSVAGSRPAARQTSSISSSIPGSSSRLGIPPFQ